MHSLFFDKIRPVGDGQRFYVTFGCTDVVECGYIDFVVADDHESAIVAALDAFRGVDAHAPVAS